MANNFGLRINLQKLNSAAVLNIKGKTQTKRCLVIPIDDNDCMFLGMKGCYIEITAVESPNNQYGATHMLKPNIPEEVYKAMSDEERQAIPILGNMKPLKPKEQQVTGSMNMEDVANQDDLPF